MNTTPGVSASRHCGSSWPQDIVWSKERREKISLFFSCQSPSVSVFRTPLVSLSRTGRYDWYFRQWVGIGGLVFSPQMTDESISHIDYIFFLWGIDADCCFSWWESRGGVVRVWPDCLVKKGSLFWETLFLHLARMQWFSLFCQFIHWLL